MKFLSDKNGVIAIEFAMLLLPFLIFLFVLIEVLLLTYESVALNWLNATAGKEAATFLKDKERRYKEIIKSHENDIGFFLKIGSYKAKVSYCKDLSELAKNSCGTDDENAKISLFELSYKVPPLFLYSWIEPNKVIKSRLVYANERINSGDDK